MEVSDDAQIRVSRLDWTFIAKDKKKKKKRNNINVITWEKNVYNVFEA